MCWLYILWPNRQNYSLWWFSHINFGKDSLCALCYPFFPFMIFNCALIIFIILLSMYHLLNFLLLEILFISPISFIHDILLSFLILFNFGLIVLPLCFSLSCPREWNYFLPTPFLAIMFASAHLRIMNILSLNFWVANQIPFIDTFFLWIFWTCFPP